MIMDKLVRVRAITTNEEVDKIQEAAHADSHHMVLPTVGMYKGDQVVGSAALGSIPIVSYWMSTKATPMETLQGISQCEAIMSAKGMPFYFLTVHEDSNFRPVVDKLGYQFVYKTNIFSKDLTKG